MRSCLAWASSLAITMSSSAVLWSRREAKASFSWALKEAWICSSWRLCQMLVSESKLSFFSTTASDLLAIMLWISSSCSFASFENLSSPALLASSISAAYSATLLLRSFSKPDLSASISLFQFIRAICRSSSCPFASSIRLLLWPFLISSAEASASFSLLTLSSFSSSLPSLSFSSLKLFNLTSISLRLSSKSFLLPLIKCTSSGSNAFTASFFKSFSLASASRFSLTFSPFNHSSLFSFNSSFTSALATSTALTKLLSLYVNSPSRDLILSPSKSMDFFS
mmetsp:Transcript_2802/g.5158  ORF Transcript_2802/g.5158 Transcript_2802/m.5158 type:complete len:281 (+) Transcript_2802:589-1431(+)